MGERSMKYLRYLIPPVHVRLAVFGLSSFLGFVAGVKLTYGAGPALMVLCFPAAAFFFWGEVRSA